ncbi:NADH dehydrogenase [ubiquinone] 1 beta subcomplex subunit 9 isoform X1 [Bos javanicus]|uniref:NADH dehydrogenase [ubiquinone] 1 beta subcomplex subunit 9 isoform X1 n=1 Tax=Bos javanicus TaxID=9906 RepID=UPI002AA8061A|nr:NADH dehydrogenase [ubiquinone] 1 beta subcomplex subunit 9 isoform X1 [Bos javanicus]
MVHPQENERGTHAEGCITRERKYHRWTVLCLQRSLNNSFLRDRVPSIGSHNKDKYRYFACLLRARFDEHKNEKDMVKATQLLREAEEEFWHGQHPQPYIFPESPGGTSYERYECYKVPEWCLDDWHPSEKAMYPDYFAKREQWKKLRRESWEREVKQLQEETPVGGPRTEALPPARKQGDLPPLWWHIVTRPRERPM